MATEKKIPKFLIIRFSSIGDIIQCMGIIGGIRKKHPDAEIHWIARKDMASFLAMDKRIGKIWPFDRKSGLKGLLRMAGELKKERYDYIYDAHSNIRSAILRMKLLPLFPGRPRFALRSKERIRRFLLFNLRINRFEWPFRGVVSYRRPLEKWGITDFDAPLPEWSFPEDYASRLRPLISADTITLVPSANWEMKRWPVEHWQALISLLPEYRFVILAGPADTFCDGIAATAPERVCNLAGKTSLLESCYLVGQSRLVISADTGFMHAADLFGIPTIALMGPTAFGFPSGPTAVITGVDLPCRPCTKDGRGKCRQDVYQKCMKELYPGKIAALVRHLLPSPAAAGEPRTES